ncbi:MAG: DNA cytosine methyltransferase [Clostridia bacterium]|jgi:hypothetical protein|nr:DNA cytosine methyltransferase [Clostridia bacterium]
MKILVACEESQAVTIELRKLGHEAYSCDILDCSGGHPEWHIKGDVLEQLDKGWDMMIAHPPCTYLSAAGARWLFKNKVLDNKRYQKGLEAKEFFLKLLTAPIDKICVENPRYLKIFNMPTHSQEIQPYQFGEPFNKPTRLWLKNLQTLKSTNTVNPKETLKYNDGRTLSEWYGEPRDKNGKKIGWNTKEMQIHRSKTFQGIAKAMALQWAGNIINNELLGGEDE